MHVHPLFMPSPQDDRDLGQLQRTTLSDHPDMLLQEYEDSLIRLKRHKWLRRTQQDYLEWCADRAMCRTDPPT
jgi:hypothetical protein